MKLALIALVAGALWAQTPAPDNTRTNKRDRSPGAVTAQDQKPTKNDREMAAKIRRSIVDDKNLSTNAHNVKIVVKDGQVTLKGPVKTEAERKVVLDKATAIAGTGKVTDETSIAPEKP